jgi:hypothetical protein
VQDYEILSDNSALDSAGHCRFDPSLFDVLQGVSLRGIGLDAPREVEARLELSKSLAIRKVMTNRAIRSHSVVEITEICREYGEYDECGDFTRA